MLVEHELQVSSFPMASAMFVIQYLFSRHFLEHCLCARNCASDKTWPPHGVTIMMGDFWYLKDFMIQHSNYKGGISDTVIGDEKDIF